MEVAHAFERAEEAEVVHPFRQRPVVPEFPEQSAEKSAGGERERAGVAAGLPVAEQARPAEHQVQRIEKQDQAEPQRVVGDRIADDERPQEREDAEQHDGD